MIILEMFSPKIIKMLKLKQIKTKMIIPKNIILIAKSKKLHCQNVIEMIVTMIIKIIKIWKKQEFILSD